MAVGNKARCRAGYFESIRETGNVRWRGSKKGTLSRPSRPPAYLGRTALHRIHDAEGPRLPTTLRDLSEEDCRWQQLERAAIARCEILTRFVAPTWPRLI